MSIKESLCCSSNYVETLLTYKRLKNSPLSRIETRISNSMKDNDILKCLSIRSLYWICHWKFKTEKLRGTYWILNCSKKRKYKHVWCLIYGSIVYHKKHVNVVFFNVTFIYNNLRY